MTRGLDSGSSDKVDKSGADDVIPEGETSYILDNFLLGADEALRVGFDKFGGTSSDDVIGDDVPGDVGVAKLDVISLDDVLAAGGVVLGGIIGGSGSG